MIPFADISSAFSEVSVTYRERSPFPHAVFPGLLSLESLCEVAAEFPRPSSMQGRFNNQSEFEKFTEQRWDRFGSATRKAVADFQSGCFVSLLETLTGIEGLIADPHLDGGGLHMTGTGGYLKIHADFNRHPRLNLHRRLNVLLYLNQEWDSGWGGDLELWGSITGGPSVSVQPTFGTLVVFDTTSSSFHGHPHPLACPEGIYRKSLAFYYYSVNRPASEQRAVHSTIFVGDSERDDQHHNSRMPTVRHHVSRATAHTAEALRALLKPRP